MTVASTARKGTGKNKGGTKSKGSDRVSSQTTPSKAKAKGKRLWTAYGRASSIAAGIAATQASGLLWRTVTGRVPPTSPENPDVSAREAAVWAVVSGSLRELARITATRKAVDYWIRTTGDVPPGMSAQSTERVAADQAAERPLTALRARMRAR